MKNRFLFSICLLLSCSGEKQSKGHDAATHLVSFVDSVYTMDRVFKSQPDYSIIYIPLSLDDPSAGTVSDTVITWSVEEKQKSSVLFARGGDSLRSEYKKALSAARLLETDMNDEDKARLNNAAAKFEKLANAEPPHKKQVYQPATP